MNAVEFQANLDQRTTRVAVVGFGYVGSCLAAALASRGFRILGIDINQSLVDQVNRGEIPFNEPGLASAITEAQGRGLLEATTDFSRVGETDVVLLCVGTPLGEGVEPDTTQVRQATCAIAPHLRAGQLVILKSTAPPGTTEEIVAPELRRNGAAGTEGDVLLAFCPERLAEGSALHDLRTIPVVVGAIDSPSRDAAMAFWKEGLGVETVPVSSPRTAELVKLADNQWIDLNIALANELAMLSERLDVDSLEVIRAANSLPKGQHHVNILTPSMGVGGSCLTKDPWFVDHLARESGLELRLPSVGRAVNDAMPAYTVDLIRRRLALLGKDLGASKVAVLGLAFKSNTGDCRLSPTMPAIAALEEGSGELTLHDPLVSAEDALLVTRLPLTPSIEEAIRDADCVAFFTGHDAFRTFPIERLAELAPGALIMDGRMYFPLDSIEQMKALGLTYAGIGR